MGNDNIMPNLQQLRYHGLDYTQIYRGTRSCLYRQTYQGETIGFEVFIITNQSETILYGIVYPAREPWPKDEDFGEIAWSWRTLEQCTVKFQNIERE